ncbi:MAG: CorA family divalent cation transporter [Acutalibacteraceae bacterium]
MFFQFNNKINEISVDEIDDSFLTVGYVNGDELLSCSQKFGFAESTVETCRKPTKYFRSGVELYDNYTFTELRIIDIETADDCVALYIRKNMLLVVDVSDKDGSTKRKFMSALRRYAPENTTLEKVIYAFFDSLVAGDIKIIEDIGMQLSSLEEELHESSVDETFSTVILEKKKLLLSLHNYYEQILDITESIDENENDLFQSDHLMYINNITKRVERLREDVDSLKNTVEHLQDAYSSYLDAKLNNTMKRFTVITSIFFPMTIIVGWYGMNFESMPEFSWKYGYIYVIALSVIVAGALAIIGKKRKWY